MSGNIDEVSNIPSWKVKLVQELFSKDVMKVRDKNDSAPSTSLQDTPHSPGLQRKTIEVDKDFEEHIYDQELREESMVLSPRSLKYLAASVVHNDSGYEGFDSAKNDLLLDNTYDCSNTEDDMDQAQVISDSLTIKSNMKVTTKSLNVQTFEEDAAHRAFEELFQETNDDPLLDEKELYEKSDHEMIMNNKEKYDDCVTTSTDAHIKPLIEIKSVAELLDRHDDFYFAQYVEVVMLVVVCASILFMIYMGSDNDENNLGGKKAAIKFYYDSLNIGKNDNSASLA